MIAYRAAMAAASLALATLAGPALARQAPASAPAPPPAPGADRGPATTIPPGSAAAGSPGRSSRTRPFVVATCA